MLPPPTIIALAGRKRAGKSTAAAQLERELVEAGRPVLRLSVAGPLKDAAVFLLDMFEPLMETRAVVRPTDNARWVESQPLKEAPIPGCGDLTARRLLQSVGEAVKSAAGRNLWADLTAAACTEWFNEQEPIMCLHPTGAVILIDDLRFPDELAALNPIASVHAWALTGGAEGDAHASESLAGFDDLQRLTPDFIDPTFAWLNPIRHALALPLA